MEREALLAQLKAFQTYLKNYVENANSRPQIEANEENKEYLQEHERTIDHELIYIDDRYDHLRGLINQEYSDLFSHISPDFYRNTRAVEHMYREISFILDTIANLDVVASNQSTKTRTNNQPFTEDEIQLINNQLDNLQNKLLETIHKEKTTPEVAMPYIESVKSEIRDLKAEVANPNLGRKDWKNHLINTMITLTFTLSFSQEARNTIFIYFQSLFIYLQQNIFLLKP